LPSRSKIAERRFLFQREITRLALASPRHEADFKRIVTLFPCPAFVGGFIYWCRERSLNVGHERSNGSCIALNFTQGVEQTPELEAFQAWKRRKV
jgi:hypothetical protein